MKKWRKVFAMALVAMLVVTSMTACGGKKEIDASAAVDAYLKAETKGEFGEYAKLTGEDEAELKEEYEETLDEVTEMFAAAETLGIDFGDDMREEFKNLLASVKYEVKDAKQDDEGNYVVDVDVYPSDVISLFFAKVMSAVQGVSDTDELGDMILQEFKAAVAEQSYGDPVTYQVHLDYNEESKQYEINESDIDALAADFYSFDDNLENLMSQMYTPTGKDYGNVYLNWTYEDWSAASEEEKTQCCLAMTQAINGLTDEEMAMIDVNDPTVQEGVQAIKDGIEMSYSSGMDLSMGDYMEVVLGMGFGE